ncbi:MAG: alanine racemase [Spirochaetes bacterium]|nr:alanine racemase [Spirochaetota bacterium]
MALMRDLARGAGKMLRPHAKTHKCSRLAARQWATGGCVGICAAKLAEAEVLLEAGIPEVLITSPVVAAARVARLVALAARFPGLRVVVDARENALALASAARQAGITLEVLVDVDPEMGRTGVSFAAAADFAQWVAVQDGLRLRGLQCYAGHLQHIENAEERASRSRALLGRAAEVFRRLRASGLPIDLLTGAGTGTAEADLGIPDLSDLQVGSYCVMDAEYLKLGGADGRRFDRFQPALTLLSTVISANHADFVTIDAGLKQLYFTPDAPPLPIGRPGTWRYEWFGDEHGRLFPPPGGARPALGERVELILPHCDPTINLHDLLWVTQGDTVVDAWEIDLRGLGQ